MRRVGLCLVVALAIGFGQEHPAGPVKPVVLYQGLGTWHHRIATKNPEAQKFFDQGLALLYGFNRHEALRSFTKASKLDPQAVMPWWGIAMAQAPHINMDLDGDVDLKKACAAVNSALQISNAPDSEREWVQALGMRCPEDRPREYSAAMSELAKRYPDDLDASTFYAESLMIPVRWRWYDKSGQPAEGVSEAEKVLEAVLRREPNHPGANHFYIHAVESSPMPERAIPSAQRLMGIVPSAGHLVHMPGHIWFLLGDYETAAAVNERAAELDRRYMKESGEMSSYFGYYVHNLHFIAMSRSMQGRSKESVGAADQIADAVKPLLEAMPDMADVFFGTPRLMRARFQQWDEVLGAPRPDARLTATTAIDHYVRAMALEARGRHAEAVAEQSGFAAARAKFGANALWLNNKADDVMAIAGEVLAARFAGSPAESISHWRRAVELQDGLVYDEPPGWYYPVRESLGAALVRAGQAAEGEAVFREGLRRSPRNGRMLFGLLESLKAQKKVEALDEVTREFQAAWGHADVTLRIEDL